LKLKIKNSETEAAGFAVCSPKSLPERRKNEEIIQEKRPTKI